MDEGRLDILLARSGDIIIGDGGDIALTDGIRQAVLVHLRWFLAEWRFSPKFGMPYFEEILVKNPDIDRIRVIIRDECLTVKGVKDITGMTAKFNARSRQASFAFNIVTAEGIYREELSIRV